MKQTVKKIAALLLSLILIICIFPTNAVLTKAETITSASFPIAFIPDEGVNGFVQFDIGTDITGLTDCLIAGVSQCSARIDISSFKIPLTNNNMQALAYSLWYKIPEAFNVGQVQFYINSTRNIISAIACTYHSFADTTAEYAAAFKTIKASADEMLLGVEGNTALTQAEKVLLIHDRLAASCEYDYDNYLAGTVPDAGFTVYGVFVNKIAVCQGYALAYLYLLNRVGIRSYYVTSVTVNHGWNVVEVDGKLYHSDVSWDDPVRDVLGRINHNFVLCSTAELYARRAAANVGENATDYDQTPTDKTYDSGYMYQNSETEVQLIDNTIYFVDNTDQMLYKKVGSSKASVCDVYDQWLHSPGYVWNGNYTRLQSVGKKLYYSLSRVIYEYDTVTGTKKAAFYPNTSVGANYSVYGLKREGNTILCELYSSPNFDSKNCENVQSFTAACSHAGTQTELKNQTDSTCLETGYTGDLYCLGCGELISNGTVVPLSDHTYNDWEITPATCTTDGQKTRYCNLCFAEETVAIAATGHSYSLLHREAATCTEQGFEAYSCAACGDNKNTWIEALGHKYVDTVTPATCTTDGSIINACERCGDIKSTTVIHATGHSYSETMRVEPTCTGYGYILYKCGGCNETYSERLAAIGHHYTSEEFEATYTERGKIVFTCSCGDTYTNYGAYAICDINRDGLVNDDDINIYKNGNIPESFDAAAVDFDGDGARSDFDAQILTRLASGVTMDKMADANDDGKTGLTDLLRAKRLSAGEDVSGNADFDGDGNVSANDLIFVRRFLLTVQG